MPRELLNANITHVSYVDKGANQKRFFLTKSENPPTFEKQVRLITKADDAKRLVYGVVYEPDVEDSHGDIMSAEEIEKAVHGFMANLAIAKGAVMDTQHDFDPGVGDVVECYIAPADFELGDETIRKGSWVLVTKANDEIWEQIQNGDITGYSMAGTAEAVEKQAQKPVAKSEDEATGFFHAMKAFFTGGGEKFTKGAVADKYNDNRRDREFWAAQNALNSVLFNWDRWEKGIETDPDNIREALQDFVDIAQEVLIQEDITKAIGNPPESVIKAGKKISASNLQHIDAAIDALTELKNKTAPAGDEQDEEEENEVKKEDIAQIVKDALAPVTDRLDKLEKSEGGNPEEVAPTPEGEGSGLAEQLKDVLKEALAPIETRLETVEKARGISRQQEALQKSEEGEDDPYNGLF